MMRIYKLIMAWKPSFTVSSIRDLFFGGKQKADGWELKTLQLTPETRYLIFLHFAMITVWRRSLTSVGNS